jgi:peroxiredoxin Q/BCP
MRANLILTASILLALGVSGAVAVDDAAPEEAPALKVGDKAPDFALPKPKDEGAESDPDTPKKLSDYKGKKNVLLAFYPKADTPGCTKQLCGYRDDIQKLQSANTEVIAVSTDAQADSDAFREKFTMPFTVLGNPDRAIVKAYGVPIMERGENLFAQRSVFLVDKEGIVRYIDLEYDIAADKDPLYAAIKDLAKPEEKAAG